MLAGSRHKYSPCGYTVRLHQLPLMLSLSWAPFGLKLKCSYLCTNTRGTQQCAQCACAWHMSPPSPQDGGAALEKGPGSAGATWQHQHKLSFPSTSPGLWPPEKTQPKGWGASVHLPAPHLPCAYARGEELSCSDPQPCSSFVACLLCSFGRMCWWSWMPPSLRISRFAEKIDERKWWLNRWFKFLRRLSLWFLCRLLFCCWKEGRKMKHSRFPKEMNNILRTFFIINFLFIKKRWWILARKAKSGKKPAANSTFGYWNVERNTCLNCFFSLDWRLQMCSTKIYCLSKFSWILLFMSTRRQNTGFSAKPHPIWVCSWAELWGPQAKIIAQQ